jgi:hypothetical protein
VTFVARIWRVPGGVGIRVSDTGIGIAPEDCVAVFEELRQVGQQPAAKAKGTVCRQTLFQINSGGNSSGILPR